MLRNADAVPKIVASRLQIEVHLFNLETLVMTAWVGIPSPRNNLCRRTIRPRGIEWMGYESSTCGDRNLLHPAVCLKEGRQPSKDAGLTAAFLFMIAFTSLAGA